MKPDIDDYAPCFCGSGKKYRFCCKKLIKEINDPFIAMAKIKPSFTETPELAELMTKGEQFLANNKAMECKELYEQYKDKYADCVPFVNNLAICNMALGHFREAMEQLRNVLKNAQIPNAFALASLAELLYLTGEDDAARNTVLIAVSIQFQTPNSRDKISEAMAYLKMHKELIEFVDSLYENEISETMLYFAGVADANTGNIQSAIDTLGSISLKCQYATLAQKTIARLKGETSQTPPINEWPYFGFQNYFLNHKEDIEQYEEVMKNSGWLVDMANIAMWERPNMANDWLDFIRYNDHPSATELLKAVVQWEQASDNVKAKAATILIERGDISQDEAEQTLNSVIKSHEKEMKIYATRLNPEISYGDPLPPDLSERLNELIDESHSPDADLYYIKQEYMKLIQARPEHFPFRNNLASVLVALGENEEAEAIYRELIAHYPDYPFSYAGLINLLINMQRFDEAEALSKEIRWPREAHPQAVVALYHALFMVNLLSRRDLKTAKTFLDFIKKIAPNSNECLNAQKWYKTAKILFPLKKKIKKGLERMAKDFPMDDDVPDSDADTDDFPDSPEQTE